MHGWILLHVACPSGQHRIDDASELVRHGRNRLGRTHAQAKPAVVGSIAHFERDSPRAASLSARETRFAIRSLAPDRRWLPDIRVPGHSPSHEQNRLAVSKRDRLLPTSETIFNAVPTSMPGTSVKSTPPTFKSARLPSKAGVFLRLPLLAWTSGTVSKAFIEPSSMSISTSRWAICSPAPKSYALSSWVRLKRGSRLQRPSSALAIVSTLACIR